MRIEGGTGGSGSFLLRGGGGGKSCSDCRRWRWDAAWEGVRFGVLTELLRGRVFAGARPSLLGNGGGAPLIARVAIVQCMIPYLSIKIIKH